MEQVRANNNCWRTTRDPLTDLFVCIVPPYHVALKVLHDVTESICRLLETYTAKDAVAAMQPLHCTSHLPSGWYVVTCVLWSP